jgi:hypothetical protein
MPAKKCRTQQRVHHQVRLQSALEERKHQLGGMRIARGQRQKRRRRPPDSRASAASNFFRAGQPQILVSWPPSRNHPRTRWPRMPNSATQPQPARNGFVEVRPKQRRNRRRQHNQYAAHGRRAGLFLVRFRAFFADELPDLQFYQTPDQPRPKHQGQKHGRQAGVHRAHGDVPEIRSAG